MSNLFPLLKPDQIECKVKKITKDGAVALLYKTARTDMDMLDETVGASNWMTDYREIKGNLYCGIAVRESKNDDWVWKWDCGIESRSDSDGNEKKGEASDAFKRAGFRWGIGRELYTAPFIFLKVRVKEDSKRGWALDDPFASFDVAEIGYTDRTISRLRIVDRHGKTVFQYGQAASATPAQTHPSADDAPADPAPAAPHMATIDQLNYIRTHADGTTYANARAAFGANLEKMTFKQALKLMNRINGGNNGKAV